jgi:hypothetical protein
VCEECGATDELGRGWRAYIAPEDDEGDAETVMYCLDCAVAEFGERRQGDRDD